MKKESPESFKESQASDKELRWNLRLPVSKLALSALCHHISGSLNHLGNMGNILDATFSATPYRPLECCSWVKITSVFSTLCTRPLRVDRPHSP